jgi:nucleoside-triphosphate--adenylate kinase
MYASLTPVFHRWIHPGSGRVYSYSYHPPKVHGLDDITGEPLVQRDDDQPASVRKRLDAYDAVTQPLIDYYEQRNILQSFAGTQSDVIYPQVKDWLQRKVFRYPQHH